MATAPADLPPPPPPPTSVNFALGVTPGPDPENSQQSNARSGEAEAAKAESDADSDLDVVVSVAPAPQSMWALQVAAGTAESLAQAVADEQEDLLEPPFYAAVKVELNADRPSTTEPLAVPPSSRGRSRSRGASGSSRDNYKRTTRLSRAASGASGAASASGVGARGGRPPSAAGPLRCVPVTSSMPRSQPLKAVAKNYAWTAANRGGRDRPTPPMKTEAGAAAVNAETKLEAKAETEFEELSAAAAPRNRTQQSIKTEASLVASAPASPSGDSDFGVDDVDGDNEYAPAVDPRAAADGDDQDFVRDLEPLAVGFRSSQAHVAEIQDKFRIYEY